MSTFEGTLITSQANELDLTAEQQNTANLLERLLGKVVSDRYVDFCRLSAGAFELRVSSPLAGHALRELDSILRRALGMPFEAIAAPTEQDDSSAATASDALRKLGYDDDAIERAVKALQPQVSHKDQIRKIVSRLGLAEDGDIARAWIAMSGVHKKAHERPFNRALMVDSEFRTEWADPFHMVVRGIAVELQGRYSALMARVEELAKMPDKTRALSFYEREIPGALPLQWHFFRNIDGPGWLPELLSRGLIVEPLPYSPDKSKEPRLHQWPVGRYLLEMAKSDDANTRGLVVHALRLFATSTHPDVRRDCLEILATLPATEAACAADLAAGWLTEDAIFFGMPHVEQIVLHLAEASETGACMTVTRALYQIFERNGHVATLFSRYMYEYSLFRITPALTRALGLEALTLFCDLLYQAAIISDKIRTDPPADYTGFSSLPLPDTEANQHDVYDALTCAVLRSSSQLMEHQINGHAVMTVLMSRPYMIYKRIALRALARHPQVAPLIAEELLFDTGLLESDGLRHEYAPLAIAWYPSMKPDRQAELLSAVDLIPRKYLDVWRKRFTEHYKRPPTMDDERDYFAAMIRNATWYWRVVLPEERQKALTEIVARLGEPDAWRNSLAGSTEESPLKPADFDTTSARDIASYLASWMPDPGPTKQTKTALAFELRNAVLKNPQKFSEAAIEFSELSPIYVRQLFEGLRQSVQNKVKIDWSPVLSLIETVLGRAKLPGSDALSEGGDDPSWYWAAKEGTELLRSGLRFGDEIVGLEHSERVKSIIRLLEQVAPERPELPDFEERYKRNAYFGAEATMFGLVVELNVLFVYWLSKQSASPIFAKPREAFVSLPEFAQFAERALEQPTEKGKIARAIFGRYFSWLLYFGTDWVKANFSKLFPAEKELRDATWLSHLLNDNQPSRDLVGKMRPLYEEEIARLSDARPIEDKDRRQERCGEYLMVLYLWGVIPNDLLASFLRNASDTLRRHCMWFLSSDIKSQGLPAEVRARARAYWEMRLAAAEAAPTKRDDFWEELGVISNWDANASGDTQWLIAQHIRMSNAGFVPSHTFGVVEWVSTIAPEHPDGAVELIEALFTNPKTDQWAYTTQQRAVRIILIAGLASKETATHQRVQRIVSYLASVGETSFLDLAKKS